MKNRLAWSIGLCSAVCMAGIATVFQFWGTLEIRSSPTTILGLTFTGAVWIFLGLKIFPWLALSFAYDIIDSRNSAAAVGLCGRATTARPSTDRVI